MRKLARRVCRPHRGHDDALSRIYRGAWLYGGIPFLILSAVLIATRRAPGLADFIFWLAAIWIVIVRYVECGCSSGEFLRPTRPALRTWRRFSVILLIAAASLYALARIAASLGRS
ncbi:MAG: hypothetical protein A2W20_02635 [Candidatus Aminicenantes bacterium RBG_16_66_30]|nr:MAG: hypothetical protein A2W20_02635 [Candidatus Aminicenantes bacterium RBG_16_66_30]